MLAEVDYNILNQDVVRQAIQRMNFSELVFSYARVAKNKWKVLSLFTDDIWIIPAHYFAIGSDKSSRNLDFNRIPVQFREVLKICVLKYFLFGGAGQAVPRGRTVAGFFLSATLFLNHVSKHSVNLSSISPILFMNFVSDSKATAGYKSEKLSVDTLRLRFVGIETLHYLSQETFDPMQHPWPDSSAATLSGKNGTAWYLKGKTPVIPDDILSQLFKAAVKAIDRVDYLLELRNECFEIRNKVSDLKAWSVATKSFLFSRGYEGGRKRLRSELTDAFTACAVIIFITSGVRSHELLSLKAGCTFTTFDDEGNIIYWMKGRSEKTYEGDTEWIVSDITNRAIDAAARISEPVRRDLDNDIDSRLSVNPECPIAFELETHRNSIFLSRGTTIETLTSSSMAVRLKAFCKRINLKWKLASHQFRRTFAVYVVRSANGDIRYLKQHFKHWSLDMTALYAAHEEKDSELLDELMAAFSAAKYDIVDHILDEATPLSGGLAESVRQFRSVKIQTYKSRAHMVKSVADSVYIRATSVGWCTNDLGNCAGGFGAESTRCSDCINGLIDDTKRPIWEGIYAQQLELITLTDIGEVGIQRVKRDIERCSKVLSELGSTVGAEM